MVIASGKAFPDGLSGGPVAAAYKAPLLLVTDGVADHAKSIFTDKEMYRLVVMGGTGAVSKAIAEDIAAPTTEAE
ncbi:MAG: cell wall-binding repeat-containing protein [Clostridia bacterium]|nr:cell wall-binding repeat-containing protein [Clostridia bacterium]